MIAGNFIVSQNKNMTFTDSNLIAGQKSTFEDSKSFKDVMNKLLEDGEIKTTSSSQAERNCRADSKANISEVNKSKNCDSAVMQKKIESAIKWLANYLGIKPSFLLAVFSELGIDPNDMADKIKLLEIIRKLCDHFNLNDEQKKEITEKLEGILAC